MNKLRRGDEVIQCSRVWNPWMPNTCRRLDNQLKDICTSSTILLLLNPYIKFLLISFQWKPQVPVIHHIFRLPHPSKLKNSLLSVSLFTIKHIMNYILFIQQLNMQLWKLELTSKVSWKFFTELWILRPALPLSLKSNSYCLVN